jgi:hypothetical protein
VWKAQATHPVQHIYGQCHDSTWTETLKVETTKLIRVVGIDGSFSDFMIPNTAAKTLRLQAIPPSL